MPTKTIFLSLPPLVAFGSIFAVAQNSGVASGYPVHNGDLTAQQRTGEGLTGAIAWAAMVTKAMAIEKTRPTLIPSPAISRWRSSSADSHRQGHCPLTPI
jgi:hypothetical protein